ncbi:hypothetical protein LR48_Vigan02g090100 [Vigna angularis]|uniref:Uncharacterized protein n=1 Tax=Phaseolus angularis TaxID=3914 RepID=A0A0L9TW89_PHAAN|nr:hypothetical protein LR48_Vigan02g090100 [Vigna angularis]
MDQSQFGHAAGQFYREPQQQWKQQPSISERWAKMDDTLQQFIQMSESHHNDTQAACRRMKALCRFIIQKLDYLKESMNPREACTTVVTESGKVLDERKIERKEEESLSEKEKDVEENKEKEESERKENEREEKKEDERKIERKEKESLSEKEKDEEIKEKEEVEREKKRIEKNLLYPKECSTKENEREEKIKGEKEDERKKKESYEKPLPHPKKYHRKEKEKKFELFMEIFKKLEVKIPMIGTLQ